MKVTDLHMHVVPGVDDGSFDMRMSLDMLELAYEQGVRDIFCTSHNVYSEEEITKYKSQFMMLQMMAKSRYPELRLHMGCELLCAGEYIDDILYGLEIGVFLPLGNSKYVLTELYQDTTPEEATVIVNALLAADGNRYLLIQSGIRLCLMAQRFRSLLALVQRSKLIYIAW